MLSGLVGRQPSNFSGEKTASISGLKLLTSLHVIGMQMIDLKSNFGLVSVVHNCYLTLSSQRTPKKKLRAKESDTALKNLTLCTLFRSDIKFVEISSGGGGD
jgi:hypothetical protein